MTVPPINLKSIMLAAQVTKVLNVIHRVAYALVTTDLIVVYASPNFNTVLSESTFHVFGRPLPELLWEFVGVEDKLKAVADGSLPFLAFERVNRLQADGRIIYLDLTVTPIQDPELGDGLLLIAEDVTEQSQMEQRLTQHRNELLLVKKQLSEANREMQRLNRLKSLFLSMAVHDLRTPLTTIRAYGDLMLRVLPGDIPPRLTDYLQIIQTQTNRMEWMIDDFLDLDLVEQGKLGLSKSPTDLNRLVQDVVDMMIYLAERRKQNLCCSYHPPRLSYH